MFDITLLQWIDAFFARHNHKAKYNPKYSLRSTRHLSGEQKGSDKNLSQTISCRFSSSRTSAHRPTILYRLACNLIFHTYENLNPEIMSSQCPKRNKLGILMILDERNRNTCLVMLDFENTQSNSTNHILFLNTLNIYFLIKRFCSFMKLTRSVSD